MAPTDIPEAADSIVLPAEPASAGRARQFVRDRVRESEHQDLEEAAALCVTELVANVSCHTDSPECVVTVVDEPGDILIEVTDSAGELPTVESTGHLSEHGRGLQIVDALAGEWGVRRDRGKGKCVWLRLFRRL